MHRNTIGKRFSYEHGRKITDDVCICETTCIRYGMNKN